MVAVYRADFYIPENMIGYTGKLGEKPTVYFSNPKTREYGHITQWHKKEDNIGRERVQTVEPGWKYVIVNEKKSDDTVRAAEYGVNLTTGQRLKLLHDSRSQYTDLRRANTSTFALLAQAIRSFPNMKTVKRR